MKIAVLQMVSAPDFAANLATAERLIDQAAADAAHRIKRLAQALSGPSTTLGHRVLPMTARDAIKRR